jgi:hypothetical protein
VAGRRVSRGAAHGPGVVGPPCTRTATYGTARACGRALERGHDVAARHASAHGGLPWFDCVYLKISQLKCTK